MNINKIIFGYDGSSESIVALEYSKFLAKKFKSEIIGVHVIEAPKGVIRNYIEKHSQTGMDRYEKEIEKNYGSTLDQHKESLAIQKINFQGKVLIGEPCKKIMEFADNENADLIVLGKRGRGLLRRMLIGSNTTKILRESARPVLVAKKRDSSKAIQVQRILVPLDVTDDIDSALLCAIELAEKFSAKIFLVYVFTFTYDFEIPYNFVVECMKASTGELLKRVDRIKTKTGTQVEINPEVIHGITTGLSITEFASKNHIDLIVTNTHGRKGLKRFILGSVAEKIVQESPCPVLILEP